MTRSMRTLTFLVALGYAVPAIAGQAVPRTSGSSSSSSGSSGGGGTSSGGGSSSSGGGSSSSGGGSGPTSASGGPMFGGESRSTPSRIASGNGSRTGTAAPRPAPAPGGVASGGGSESSSSSRVGSGSEVYQGFGGDPSFARTRNGRPITGTAAVRPNAPGLGGGDFVSFPFYGPWGTWYPWYSGFGWNLGFVTYNPWNYGAARWFWSPYGMWYDPYTYWDPFWSYGSGGYYREREPKAENTIGSIRIKASPANAKVYIDNALVGLVEEFDGLNENLDIEGGRHTLEIRADGYATHSEEVDVKAGKTRTIRVNLKKK